MLRAQQARPQGSAGISAALKQARSSLHRIVLQDYVHGIILLQQMPFVSQPLLVQARMDKERIEAEKAEVVAQASSQKQVLVSEVSMLRNEIIQASRAPPSASKGFGRPVPGDVADALERRKAFEEQFSMTMRQLREELMGTSIKQLSGRSQTPQSVRALLALSDERISRIMEEAYQVFATRQFTCSARAVHTKKGRGQIESQSILTHHLKRAGSRGREVAH